MHDLLKLPSICVQAANHLQCAAVVVCLMVALYVIHTVGVAKYKLPCSNAYAMHMRGKGSYVAYDMMAVSCPEGEWDLGLCLVVVMVHEGLVQ